MAEVLRPDRSNRLSICVNQGERFVGIPRDPDMRTKRVLSKVIATERGPKDARTSRGDAPFVVLQVLLHHWLRSAVSAAAEFTRLLAFSSGVSRPHRDLR